MSLESIFAGCVEGALLVVVIAVLAKGLWQGNPALCFLAFAVLIASSLWGQRVQKELGKRKPSPPDS